MGGFLRRDADHPPKSDLWGDGSVRHHRRMKPIVPHHKTSLFFQAYPFVIPNIFDCSSSFRHFAKFMNVDSELNLSSFLVNEKYRWILERRRANQANGIVCAVCRADRAWRESHVNEANCVTWQIQFFLSDLHV
jgi:hypothetical protein